MFIQMKFNLYKIYLFLLKIFCKIAKYFLIIIFLLFILSYVFTKTYYIKIDNNNLSNGKNNIYSIFELDEKLNKTGIILKINENKIYSIKKINSYNDDKSTSDIEYNAIIKYNGKLYLIDDRFTCFNIFSMETYCDINGIWSNIGL